MKEKFEIPKYVPKDPQEIASYMAERLKRENTETDDIKAKKLKPEEIHNKALELFDLTLEKEDLIQAFSSDEKTLNEPERTKKETEITEKTDLDSVDFRKVGRQFSSSQSIKESTEETKKELEDVKRKIAEFSSNEKVLDEYESILAEKIQIIKMARQVEGAREYLNQLGMAESKLLAHRNSEDVKLTSADKKVLEENEKRRGLIESKIKEWMSNPDIYYEVNKRQFLDYRKQLLKDGFVETSSVQKEIAQIRGHLELGIPVFLRGHLGAGKTEILLHIARKYYGCEPEFISGSEEATKYDIYGKTQIGVRSEEDRNREFKIRMDEYMTMNPNVKGKELKQIEKQYYDEIIVKGQTTSFFQYGPLVRAMKEGKPIIIDEIDGIPHSILMRLNHVLTRKTGDKFKIQENGGEEIGVNRGFCVMATGNIKSAKYKREELDAAFLSRWWSSEIRYLPQDEEIKILTASLIDKRGNLDMKSPEDFDALKRLAQSAEEIQKIFTGEKTDVFGEGGDAARGISASLEKSVLSMRDLWNIVKPWKAHNFDKPLDSYIYTEFIKKATVPKDAVYLTQLFCRFGFFRDWEAEQFQITGLDKKKLDAFRAKKPS